MQFLTKLKAWFATSSSIIGTSGIGGALTAVASGASWISVLPLLVGGVIAILMPQRPQIAADARTIVTDTVKLVGDLNVTAPPAAP